MQKLEVTGIEVNRERKHLRLRTSPEHRYTRCDTLKGDYTEQAIRERIAGTRRVTPRRTSYKKPAQKIGMLVDIEAASVPEKVLVMNVGRKYSILNNFFRRCFI